MGKGAEVPTSRTLVIVESPAKAKTIQKYLGPDFDVEASVGHVRDLPERAVDVPAIERELAAQFRQQLRAGTYRYEVRASCTAGTPDELNFNCLISTVGPVGIPPKVLTWKETVSCRVESFESQRCASSGGDALG